MDPIKYYTNSNHLQIPVKYSTKHGKIKKFEKLKEYTKTHFEVLSIGRMKT